MPQIPAVGVFFPNGYLNVGSFAGPSGQQDAYGLNYPTGISPGKIVYLTPPEARMAAAPNTTLYDGAYQVVQLDSGATAANAVVGLAAYIRLDSGATVGALPETSYEVPTVTTGDIANQIGSSESLLFAGVFVTPATVNGVAATPVPGQYMYIFVGGGRATCTLTSGQSASVGQQVWPNTGANATTFQTGSATATVTGFGISVFAAASGGNTVAYFPNVINRFGGQGV